MSLTARRAAVGVLGLLPLAVTAATAAWWWDALPAQLPTHWSGTDLPDGFDSRGGTVAVVLSLTAAGGLLVATTAWGWFTRSPAAARGVVAAGGFLGGLAAAMWLSTAGATLAAGSAEEARLGWWLLLDVIGGAWAAIALLLRDDAVTTQRPDRAADPGRPFRAVGPGERASWVRVIGPTWLTWVLVGLLVVEVVVALAVPATAPVVVLALALTLVFARLEITVDHRGLRLVAGLLRLPLKRIPLQRVAHADVEDLVPGEWGGWGYRVMPGRSALVLRGGPALVVTLPDGRRFAATVDDPATPAALLNGLAAAQDR